MAKNENLNASASKYLSAQIFFRQVFRCLKSPIVNITALLFIFLSKSLNKDYSKDQYNMNGTHFLKTYCLPIFLCLFSSYLMAQKREPSMVFVDIRDSDVRKWTSTSNYVWDTLTEIRFILKPDKAKRLMFDVQFRFSPVFENTYLLGITENNDSVFIKSDSFRRFNSWEPSIFVPNTANYTCQEPNSTNYIYFWEDTSQHTTSIFIDPEDFKYFMTTYQFRQLYLIYDGSLTYNNLWREFITIGHHDTASPCAYRRWWQHPFKNWKAIFNSKLRYSLNNGLSKADMRKIKRTTYMPKIQLDISSILAKYYE